MARLTLYNFGGLTRLPRQRGERMLPAEEAVDVDLINGTLRPIHTDTLVDAKDGDTVFVEDCCTQVLDNCAQVTRVPVPCVKYFRTGVERYPEETSDPCGTWCRSGLPCPEMAPIMMVGTTKTREKVIERQYFYTFIKADGSESAPSPVTAPIPADWDLSAVISGFETPDPSWCITGIKVYSTAPSPASNDSRQAESTAFFHVGTIDLGTSTFTHQPLSTEYGDAWLADTLKGPPPDGLHDIQFWDGSQLAGLAGDGTLRFTHPRELGNWPDAYTLKPYTPPLRFLAANEYGYLLNCGHPEMVDLRLNCKGGFCHSIQKLDESHPLISLRSAAVHQSNVVYASDDGLVMLSGNQSAVITEGIISRDDWLAMHPNTMVGVVHDGYYYGFTDNTTFRFRLPGKTHAVDHNGAFTKLSIRAKHAYVAENGTLYYLAADGSGVYSMGTGAGFKSMLWRSVRMPRLGHTHFSYATVDTAKDGEPVDLTISNVCGTGETKVHLRSCTKSPLPRWLKLDEIQIEVTGKTEVYEVSFGTPFTHQYEPR